MTEYNLPHADKLRAQVAEVEARLQAEFDAAVLAFTKVIGAKMAEQLLAAAKLGTARAVYHFDLPEHTAYPSSVARAAAMEVSRIFDEQLGYKLTYDIDRASKLRVTATY